MFNKQFFEKRAHGRSLIAVFILLQCLFFASCFSDTEGDNETGENGTNFISVTYYTGSGSTSGTVPVDGTGYMPGDTVKILQNTGTLVGPEVGGEHSGSGIKQRFVKWNTEEDGSGTDYLPDDTFEISENIKLYAIYTTGTDVLRKVGPAGGWVFYDHGSNATWGRYLEAANSDHSTAMRWWYADDPDTDCETDTSIGSGASNTAKILAKHGTRDDLTAAGATDTYTQGGYSDWFLPSRDELITMYNNLHKVDVGNFNIDIDPYPYYWSSSEDTTPCYCFRYDFKTQTLFHSRNTVTHRVRPIRAF